MCPNLSNRVAIGDTTIKQSANSTYDGTRAALMNPMRRRGSLTVSRGIEHQMTTTGTAEMPQTVPWTTTSDRMVHVVRHITTMRDGGRCEVADVIVP